MRIKLQNYGLQSRKNVPYTVETGSSRQPNNSPTRTHTHTYKHTHTQTERRSRVRGSNLNKYYHQIDPFMIHNWPQHIFLYENDMDHSF